MSIFSNKDYRFKNLEELQMEKFQLQLQLQLLKEEMKRSATGLKHDFGVLGLKALLVPVAAKTFSSAINLFSSENGKNESDESNGFISSIPSILKGIKYGLDIYDKFSEEYQSEEYL
jgi:hypothetical protein